MTDIFAKTSNLLKYCIDETNTKIKTELEFMGVSPDCNDPCFQEGNTKIILEKRECINKCFNDDDYKYDYNDICYKTCPYCTLASANDQYLCEEKLECEEKCQKYKYNTDCFDEIPEGYYLLNAINNTLDKCHEDCKTCDKKENSYSTNCKTCPTGKFLLFGNCVNSCKNSYEIDLQGNKICKCSAGDKCKDCSKESYDLDLCISCNSGFYPKIDENVKLIGNNEFKNCYKNPERYYLDIRIQKYKPCHSNCETCSGEGTDDNNNCDKCISNLVFADENDKNCYEICNNYYYYDASNNYHCTQKEECPKEQSKLISKKRKCIDECKKDDIYTSDFLDFILNNCKLFINFNIKNAFYEYIALVYFCDLYA
jgi:hypothetical protein